MRITQIKRQLHNYIDSAEVKKLKALYTLLENDITNKFPITVTEKKELVRRYDDYMNGIGKTYTWDETMAMSEKALVERKNNK